MNQGKLILVNYIANKYNIYKLINVLTVNFILLSLTPKLNYNIK